MIQKTMPNNVSSDCSILFPYENRDGFRMRRVLVTANNP